MSELLTLALPSERAAADPFPHAELPTFLSLAFADSILEWLETEELWRLRVEDFYEQHEFSLLATRPPGALSALTAEPLLIRLRDWLQYAFEIPNDLDLVDVSAHRLTGGQTIRIHNDYLGGAETHRILVQLNRGWSAEQGGLLMLFATEEPAILAKYLLPVHGEGFAFAISPRSHHAVSTIHSGERYTLVYTWRAAAEP